MATTQRSPPNSTEYHKVFISNVIVDFGRFIIPISLMFNSGTFLDGLILLVPLASFPATSSDGYVIVASCILIYFGLFKVFSLAMVFVILSAREKKDESGIIMLFPAWSRLVQIA